LPVSLRFRSRAPRDLQGRCTGSLDLCFITEGSLNPIIERWKSHGIPITAGPAPAALDLAAPSLSEGPVNNVEEQSEPF
jgi:hypothetical protein